MLYVSTIVGVSVLVVGSGAVYSSLRIVEEGDLEALLVLGEMRAVLHPGLNVVPPFVSKTYPIDPRTMTMDRGNDRVDVPAQFEDEVRAARDR